MRTRSQHPQTGLLMLAVVIGWSAVQAQDEAPGGLLCAFRYSRKAAAAGDRSDADVRVQRVAPGGTRAWGTDNRGLAVGDSLLDEGSPAVCSDGRGGAIVVYTGRGTTEAGAVRQMLYAQRVGPDGRQHWLTDRVPPKVAPGKGVQAHPVVLSDGEHGAFVAFVWDLPNGKQGVLVQRLGADGSRVWPVERRPAVLAATRGCDRPPVLVSDGRGGVIVLFESESRTSDRDLWAGRVAADGTLPWGGRVALSRTKHDERWVAAVGDGDGGLIAAFEVSMTSGSAKGEIDIYAQRLSGEGRCLWREGKAPEVVSSLPGPEGRPVAVSDGAGGILIAFDYTGTSGERAGDQDVLAQRLDGRGAMQWNEGRRAVNVASSPAHERAPAVVAMEDGGMTVVFEVEHRGGARAGNRDVGAQRLGGDGVGRWHEGKRSSLVFDSALPEVAPLVVSDGAGGVYVVAAVQAPPTEEITGVVALLTRRIDARGRLVWSRKAFPRAGVGLGPDLCPSVIPLALPPSKEPIR